MLIEFHDFIPQRQQKRLLGVITEYENLHEVVSRVNMWIEQHHVEVLNIETVLMPSLPNEATEATKTRMESAGTTMSSFQIVRVWYRQRASEVPYTAQTKRLDTP